MTNYVTATALMGGEPSEAFYSINIEGTLVEQGKPVKIKVLNDQYLHVSFDGDFLEVEGVVHDCNLVQVPIQNLINAGAVIRDDVAEEGFEGENHLLWASDVKCRYTGECKVALMGEV